MPKFKQNVMQLSFHSSWKQNDELLNRFLLVEMCISPRKAFLCLCFWNLVNENKFTWKCCLFFFYKLETIFWIIYFYWQKIGVTKIFFCFHPPENPDNPFAIGRGWDFPPCFCFLWEENFNHFSALSSLAPFSVPQSFSPSHLIGPSDPCEDWSANRC